MNARMCPFALSLLLATGCAVSEGSDARNDAANGGSPPRGVEALTAHVTALDPAVHRAGIEAVETALFGGTGGAPAAPPAVAAALRHLGEEVSSEPIVLAKALGAEMIELANRAEAGQDPATLADRWTRIRDGLFESAPWFHGGAAQAMR